LLALGYVEGQNVVIEYRWAEGREDRLREFAAELVSLNVDVLFAASASAVRAAWQATRTLPIVAFDLETDRSPPSFSSLPLLQQSPPAAGGPSPTRSPSGQRPPRHRELDQRGHMNRNLRF
jgi:hypothetical protein